jgi:malate synthase
MRLTILLLSLIIHTGLFAQTTYNVFTYAEPKGYKKEVKSGFISYTKTDNKAGTYCIISLYAQSPSSGDLVKDFDNDWKELVATPLGVTTAPEKDNGDEITGWKTNSGGANFTFSGGTSMALLTTAKMDNANVAILVVTNAQSLLSKTYFYPKKYC